MIKIKSKLQVKYEAYKNLLPQLKEEKEWYTMYNKINTGQVYKKEIVSKIKKKPDSGRKILS